MADRLGQGNKHWNKNGSSGDGGSLHRGCNYAVKTAAARFTRAIHQDAQAEEIAAFSPSVSFISRKQARPNMDETKESPRATGEASRIP
jgi:hypothetical protein